jgi:geranylgeranyl pyrophosphate synthase
MRLALRGSGDGQVGDTLSRFSVLPGLCCQAAGGEPDWADDLTLGWLLFYRAADLMDSVQDGDEPDPWWAEQGAGAALATASGLYFSGSLALNRLQDRGETKSAAAEIASSFYNTFLVMTSGQYGDLLHPQPTLAQYWQYAASKSGAFFSLACWCGARLATGEPEVLQGYQVFGAHLGILIQVMDDMEDIRLLHEKLHSRYIVKVARSLPFVYALEVGPLEFCARLRACLVSAAQSQEAAAELVSLLDQCGAARYVLVEMEKHRSMALQALTRANPAGEFKLKLAALVQEM